MIKQECIGIPDMILLLMNFFCFKKIKIIAELVLSPGGAYFIYCCPMKVFFESCHDLISLNASVETCDQTTRIFECLLLGQRKLLVSLISFTCYNLNYIVEFQNSRATYTFPMFRQAVHFRN